ncbi:o-succinylbenzoate synthase [Ruania zhangjianzhongii]|uniref:o-succinylbenzoate synthase n=1 Tax=Ruania zhangjianzhongii TaxID=2603206 RepID=UPI0011C824B2|nr:o-succinylbenzoate synthase [Ruania zhangjianzhongii]
MHTHCYSIPLHTRFRGLTLRDGLLIRGDAGWGEFSPFWDYDAPTSRPWWNAAREAADQGFPAPLRTRIPVNVTVPATTSERAHEIVAGSGGCTTAKVKVAEPGQDLGAEQARLEAVRDALGPGGKIRIDANAAWDYDEARRRLPILDRAAGGLEYAEQPCREVADLAALRRSTEVPIAADESIRRAADPYEVARAEAADVVVVKVQPLGGVRAALRIAEDIGLPVVVSSALETSVGIAAGLALAAALPTLEHACGLATVNLFTDDVTDHPLLPVDGAIDVRSVEPTPERLAATAAGPELTTRWANRLRTVAGSLP